MERAGGSPAIWLIVYGSTQEEIPPPYTIQKWWEDYIGPWTQVRDLSRRAIPLKKED